MPAAVIEAPIAGNSSLLEAEQPELSKKRKQPVSVRENEDDGEVQRKKKPMGKGGSGGSGGNASKDVRWAEQLLNPCAAAAQAGHLSRVQHLLYVLRELASPSGDANHRLAAHGLRALTRHLSSVGAAVPPLPVVAATPASYATTEPKLFRSALIKFREVSPWFALPNALANASIIHALDSGSAQRPRPLHVIDIGVSHGVQWPTLLEALTHRPGGPPPLVRITVAGSAIPHGPFSSAPPGYDFSTPLLRYAKSIDLNLRIDHADTISTPILSSKDDDAALVVCAQFRMGHACAEERTAILNAFRSLEPELVVLSEIDWDRNATHSGRGSGNGFLAGFPRRAELLWRFLESTAAAVKGRESAERRVVEGEAAGWLETAGENEGAAEWRERMAAAGFREEGFAEEAVDAGRALLRKYDSNWEMRAAVAAAGMGLWWKGQPVSFCSLWKLQGQS